MHPSVSRHFFHGHLLANKIAMPFVLTFGACSRQEGVASEALQPLVKEISLDHQANKLRVFSLTAATTRQLCWIKVAIA
jgi:hypothetical protein